jgi:carboxyl-terminal processing protease
MATTELLGRFGPDIAALKNKCAPIAGHAELARLAGLRAATGMAIAMLAASCSSGPLQSSQFGFANGDFESVSEEHPELFEVSEAFDRLVSPSPSEEERERQLDLFSEVFLVAYTDYVEPVSASQMVTTAVAGFENAAGDAKLGELAGRDASGGSVGVEQVEADNLMSSGLSRMLTELDPHSAFLTADDYREMKLRTRGEFGGIGIEVTMHEGLVKVVAPIDDTPGAEAGLLAGDLITHVDDTAIMGLNLSEAVRLMRGRAGTAVNLTIQRPPEEETFDVSIIRDVVRIRAVRSHREGNIAYLRITTFNERAEEGVRRAMKQLRAEIGDPLQGVVLDLRNNPGGLLDQALGISDAFLSGGEIVSTRTRDDGVVRKYSAVRGDIAQDLPIMVLINGGSASAAEIVSGALQDHDRATVIGARSFGKGSVQTIMPISDGAAVRLTTARYYTPSGRAIQLTGIIPDIMANTEDADRTREADLEHALEAEAAIDESAAQDMAGVCPDVGELEDPVLACALVMIEASQTMAASPVN